MQKSDKKVRLYGKLLSDFANAQTPEEGIDKLIQNIHGAFNFSSDFIENEKAKLSDSQSLLFLSQCEAAIDNLKEFFNDFLEDRNLYNNSHFTSFYLVDYNVGLLPRLIIEEDGSLTEETVFSERSFEIEPNTYGSVISYCVVTFFRSKKNRQLLNKCKHCGNFFIANRKRKKGEGPFCITKCRRNWHNREAIKTGRLKEYKRKKREEGAKESYYG